MNDGSLYTQPNKGKMAPEYTRGEGPSLRTYLGNVMDSIRILKTEKAVQGPESKDLGGAMTTILSSFLYF